MAYDDQVLNEILLESGTDDYPGDEAFGDEPELFGEFEYDYGDSEQMEFGEMEGYDGYDSFEALGVDDDLVLSPQEEEELALELMQLESEAELEEFLGKLWKKARKGISKVARRVKKKIIPAAAKFIKGPGRKLLAKALPMIGSAVGTAFAPGAGTQIGGAAGGILGSLIGGGAAGAAPAPAAAPPGLGALGGLAGLGGMPGGAGGLGALAGLLGGGAGGGGLLSQLIGSGAGGNLLGALMGGEMEHATLEEAKFDLSKRMVRTISQAAKDAVVDPRAAVDPQRAAKAALTKAVRKNIPAGVRQVLAASAAPTALTGAAAGQWVRRGNQIVLLGA